MQTIASENGFKDSVYCIQHADAKSSIHRLIDWKRGTPYVFRAGDYNELMESNWCLLNG